MVGSSGDRDDAAIERSPGWPGLPAPQRLRHGRRHAPASPSSSSRYPTASRRRLAGDVRSTRPRPRRGDPRSTAAMAADSEAIALQDALPRAGGVPWEIGKVYNALLAAAKHEKPDSISLAALDPLERNAIGFAGNVTPERLRTVL